MEQIDRIEDYLLNRMNPPEKAAFEADMESDAEMRREVKKYRLALTALRVAEKQKWLTQLREANKNHKENEKNGLFGISRNRFIIFLVGLLLFILSFLYFFYPSPSDKLEKIIQARPVAALVTKSANNELLEQAQTAFNTGDFDQAIGIFKQLNQVNDINYELLYYQGIAERLSGNLENAKSTFKLLDDLKQEHLYEEQAQWEWALSYLQEKDYETAIQKLEIIRKNPEGDLQEDAGQLIKLVQRIQNQN